MVIPLITAETLDEHVMVCGVAASLIIGFHLDLVNRQAGHRRLFLVLVWLLGAILHRVTDLKKYQKISNF